MSTVKILNNTAYQKTFQDNFDTFNPFKGHQSSGHWLTSFSPHMDDTRFLSSNEEGQYYANPDEYGLPNPFSVNNGILSIHAHTLTDNQKKLTKGQDYVSGLLSTELTFGSKQGYIEISAKVPDQAGFLSSFWLLPEDGDWSSEIDIFETLGRNTSLLNTNIWKDGASQQVSIKTEINMAEGFHTYGLEWNEDTITWYLDGEKMRITPNTVNEKMYLVASLAVDTNWTGAVDETTDFSDAFEIDYIHVYETDTVGKNPIITGNEIMAEPIVYGQGAGPEKLFGTTWSDIFKGGGSNDRLYGREGHDEVHGEDGNDILFGQIGDDALYGGQGHDKIIGGNDSDIIDGGKGTDHLWGGAWTKDQSSDTFVFEKGDGKDFIHDFEVGTDQIDLTALNIDWGTLQQNMADHGWATKLDFCDITGNSGDVTYIIGTSLDSLTQDYFLFSSIA